ncbi:MAG: hypothetical protein HYV36_05330 [Lentisphaerae bacterium]|nr:hypothetical protein [Lentisphaerota bacterium]
MTARERLLNTLRGLPVDRIPVYTLIPFGLREGQAPPERSAQASAFIPAAFHGYADADPWRANDPAYRILVQRMADEGDNFFVWRPPCLNDDRFLLPTPRLTTLPPETQDVQLRVRREFVVGNRVLSALTATQPGMGHTWQLEHPCKSLEDAAALLELPWESGAIEPGDFFELERMLGEHGLMWVTVPSPLSVVARLFDPSDFLILTRTSPALIDRLMETAAERIGAVLKPLLEAGVGPIVRFGGAEHATPPLMGPADFDHLVVRYDTPLIRLCKQYGRFVAVHCHGRIRHALARFVEMGVDQTDPVEEAPDGDLTAAEARRLAAGRITLTGNIQMRELHALAPDEIEARVKRLIAEAGPDHLIVSTTGTPLERMAPRLADNYHRLIDAVLKYGHGL